MLHSRSCNGSAPFYGQHTIVGYSIGCFSGVISIVGLKGLASVVCPLPIVRIALRFFRDQNQEIKQFKSAPG